jgi:hypothetical protein
MICGLNLHDFASHLQVNGYIPRISLSELLKHHSLMIFFLFLKHVNISAIRLFDNTRHLTHISRDVGGWNPKAVPIVFLAKVR